MIDNQMGKVDEEMEKLDIQDVFISSNVVEFYIGNFRCQTWGPDRSISKRPVGKCPMRGDDSC